LGFTRSNLMHVHVLDKETLVPSVVTHGFVLQLGRDDAYVIFLCDGATHADAVQFQTRFCRQANFLLREQPMSIETYNEIMRARHGDKVTEKAPIVQHRRFRDKL